MYEVLEGRAPLGLAHNPRYQRGHYALLAPKPPCASESDDASDDDRRQSPLGRGHDDYVISGEESVSDASSDAGAESTAQDPEQVLDGADDTVPPISAADSTPASRKSL